MIVRVRLGRGAVRSGRAGKNSRIARVTAYVLTLASISCAAFGIWRLGDDLGWTGDFVFTAGALSHWQVWVGAAMLAQYAAWRLTVHARKAVPQQQEQEQEPEHPHVSVASKV
jgi:hypothetical protein